MEDTKINWRLVSIALAVIDALGVKLNNGGVLDSVLLLLLGGLTTLYVFVVIFKWSFINID